MLPIPDALYVINHSGGKDSQAMYLLLKDVVPAEQLVVIHAHLPEVEWAGTMEHIQNTIGTSEFHVVQAKKTFFEMVEHRKMFPSSENRQCTSDLKRGPIAVKVNQICKERGFTKIVNCMGLRAEESSNRAKKEPFRLVPPPKRKKKPTKSGKIRATPKTTKPKKERYEWLPIHTWTTTEVFNYISTNSQQPHWAYAEGMTRLSCCFCIMASKEDLKTAARLNPELYEKYNEVERRLDHTLLMPTKKHGKLFLTDIVNA